MCFKFFRVLVVAIFFFSTPVWSQPCEKVAAVIESMEGGGVVKPLETERWQPVKVGHQFCYGDTFKVEKLRAVLRLENDTLVKLNSGSVLKFVPPKESFWVELVDGVAHFISRTPKSFTVKAPYVNAAVEGTEFIIAHKDQQDTVSVVEGLVVAENTLGSTRLQAMQQSTVVQGGAPSHALVISLPDVADWSLYYPPAFIPANTQSPAVQAYLRGDFALSYQLAIEEKEEELTAALALFYGQSTVFDEAIPLTGPLVAQILSVFQNIVRGEALGALSDAEGLVDFYPEQPSPLLALSYAQQANGELSLALASALKAHALSNSAVVDLRIAELALITGDQALAKRHLNSISQAGFYSAYADSLQALIALQNNRNRKALKILTASANKNVNTPLTQFAIGLTHIRLGKLEQGRQKLELAVALDPSNSLYRSYLGKAYAEEYRSDKAQDQLDLAKILDPDDPTPWFYQGLNQQASGEYASAIQSYEKSLELNDSRYTYRSGNVLQSDAAIKSANIGTAYSQRGLKKKAELLGSQIISEDPSSYAGHRLLVEAYSDDNQRESLLASSRLKATLAQPLGATALPIGLLEPGLQTVIGASPTDIGISEYTQLFIEDGLGGHATLLGGSEDLRAYDVLVQGKREQVSVNLGQYKYETDGYRENNDVSYLISNALIHWQPIKDLSLQFEFGEFEEDYGDLHSGLDAEYFYPDERFVGDSSIKRLSASYRIGDRKNIIFNYSKRKQSTAFSDIYIGDIGEGVKMYNNSLGNLSSFDQFDGQYQYQTNQLGNFILGFNYSDYKSIDEGVYYEYPVVLEENLTLNSMYVDYMKTFNKEIQINVGLDFSSIDQVGGASGSFVERKLPDDFLYYAGVKWDAFSDLSLRGIYSEAYAFDSQYYVNLKAADVLGFSRIVDFPQATQVDLFGLGVDWGILDDLSISVERKDYRMSYAVYKAADANARYEDLLVDFLSKVLVVEYSGSQNYTLILKLENKSYISSESAKEFNYLPVSLDSDYSDIELKLTPVPKVEISLLGRYVKQDLLSFEGGPVISERSATLNASISYYLLNRRGTIKVGVNNVGDKKYLIAQEDLFSLQKNTFNRAIKRTYFGSVSYNF